MLYLHHREKQTKVLGPGIRYVLWVQGCAKRCKGCINPEGQPMKSGGYWMKIKDVLSEIKAEPSLMGITISGGEPFLQPIGLSKLVKSIREETSLDIMLYSGYTLKELRDKKDDNIDFVLNNCDLLIDGEYVEELNNNHIYRGSDNQVIHCMSDKYRPFMQQLMKVHNRDVEFTYAASGLFMIGLPEKGFMEKLNESLLKKIKKE